MERRSLRAALILVLVLLLAVLVSSCSDGETGELTEETDTDNSEKVMEEENVKNTVTELPENREPYYLVVNCTTNTVTIYAEDSNGEYTVPLTSMLCSSGLDEEDMSTPKGEYALTGNRWEWLKMIDGTYGIYVTQILGDYLFHSVPYTEYGNHGSLKPGEFDKLGSDASHGCIRLCIRDAKWIYDNMENITGVNIMDSENPGPLGRPALQKIGDGPYPEWDPTDAHADNPWNR